MKQMEVTILGQSYILACPDGGERALLDAVARVDTEMSKIRDSGKVRARERMAVLAALNLAYVIADTQINGPQSESSAASHALPEADAPVIHQLIKRIDDALGADGQLI